jgi:ubiquitin carboxyl-terminal hydrolase L5
VLLNAHDRVELGDELSQFREFTQEFDADTKGLAVSNSEVIRTAHNSFARPEPIVIQSRPARDDDDVFHFVAYVPKDGCVYELDGLRDGPINHGPFSDSKWLEVAVPAIQRRIENYSTQEIKFNLLAVTEDARKRLRERLAELSARDAVDMVLDGEMNEIKSELEREEAKEARWRDENIRRRHNYLPLILRLLKELAAKGELQPLIDAARAKHS